MLLYNKFSANSHAQKIIIKILKKLSHSITEYINQHKFPGKLPLVCSQFVAECYDNAGEAYQLKFDQPTVASNEAANKANTHNFPQKNLLQHALDSKQTFSASNSKARTGTPEVITEALEDLCQALQQAVQAGNIVLEGISNPSDAAAPSNELLTAAADLAQAHHQASHISKGNQTVFLATGQQSINFMLEDNYHNFFTFPGDLLLHCPSLEDIGIIGG